MKRMILFLPLLLCLCSCWDYTEPGAQDYVMGVGFDYVDGKYLVSIETVKITGEPTALSASEGIITESEGATPFDAVRNVIMKAGKKLYWGHTEIVIISEEIAKNHLHSVLDVISRSQDVFSNVNLTVSHGCMAKDILSASIPRDIMASVHISNILENEEPSRRFKCCELWQLQRDFPYTPIPTLHLKETPVVEGCAVIFDGALKGFLSGRETQVFSLIEESQPGGYLSDIRVGDNLFSLEILQVKTLKRGDTCRIDVIVALSNSEKPYDISSPENRKALEQAATEVIKSDISSLLSKPYGNPLSFNDFTVHVTLNSAGLKKR